jgi:cbb3-type cytochrome oxidase subunit 1
MLINSYLHSFASRQSAFSMSYRQWQVMSLYVTLSGPDHLFQAAYFLWLQALRFAFPLVLFPPLIDLNEILVLPQF